VRAKARGAGAKAAVEPRKAQRIKITVFMVEVV
jgi:hypothetical protein